jgi:L-ascorbate metabolism protein UlaG (beta-lactamase superfamily)
MGTAAVGIAGGAAFLNTPQFGRKPSKDRLERLIASPNWRDGAFCNLEPLRSPAIPRRESRLKTWWRFLLADQSELGPKEPLKTDRSGISRWNEVGDDFVSWLGHSSVFMRIGGKNILIDPVFSPYASPVPFINRSFPYEQDWTGEDFPDIDLLAISHDHWDHLDYPTVTALLPKIKKAVCPLGVGEYLEQWGLAPELVSEGDWWDKFDFGDVSVALTPSRHFSGRFTRRNQTLWCGFVFESGTRRIFFSGDGGWGRHFAEIARRFAPVDIAFIENGQYNVKWPSVHLHPNESALAAKTVGAKVAIPIHNSRFTLSDHAWDEPARRFAEECERIGVNLLRPMMGETVDYSHSIVAGGFEEMS